MNWFSWFFKPFHTFVLACGYSIFSYGSLTIVGKDDAGALLAKWHRMAAAAKEPP